MKISYYIVEHISTPATNFTEKLAKFDTHESAEAFLVSYAKTLSQKICVSVTQNCIVINDGETSKRIDIE